MEDFLSVSKLQDQRVRGTEELEWGQPEVTSSWHGRFGDMPANKSFVSRTINKISS
jgi:hypothetical protein